MDHLLVAELEATLLRMASMSVGDEEEAALLRMTSTNVGDEVDEVPVGCEVGLSLGTRVEEAVGCAVDTELGATEGEKDGLAGF